MTRVAFLGTPDSAVPTLQRLAEEVTVPAVITRPDKPRGRSGEPQPSPVKVAARDLGIPVLEPQQSTDVLAALEHVAPLDLAVLVAYGLIIRADALDFPTHGILNAHFSLLPRWRGAAPVARAIMAGDSMSGVTIIRLDEGLDSGDVLTAQAVDVGEEESAGELTVRLSDLAARLMVGAVGAYLSGDLEPVAQSEDGLTYASKITSDDRSLNTTDSVEDFINHVRALAPDPGATLEIDGKPHKILRAYPSTHIPGRGTWSASGDVPVVGLAVGAVEIAEIQPPGKTAMSGEAWLRGRMKKYGEVS